MSSSFSNRPIASSSHWQLYFKLQVLAYKVVSLAFQLSLSAFRETSARRNERIESCFRDETTLYSRIMISALFSLFLVRSINFLDR